MNFSSLLSIALPPEKILSSKTRFLEFCTSETEIYAVPCGIDVNVYYDKKYEVYLDNVIITENELDYAPDTKIKKYSFGASRLKFLISFFNNAVEIEPKTLLRVRFIVDRAYSKRFRIVLLDAYSAERKLKFGRPRFSLIKDLNVNAVAKKLGVDVPNLVFKGTLESEYSFRKGSSKDLIKIFETYKNSMLWNNYEDLYNRLKEMLFILPGKYGKIENGFLFVGSFLTFLQNPLFEPEVPPVIDETLAKNYARDLIDGINIKNRNLSSLMKEFAKDLSRMNYDLQNLRDTQIMQDPQTLQMALKDKIYSIGKHLIFKNLNGNAGAIVLGKFKILTKQQVQVLNRALRDYDSVTVCVLGDGYLRDEMLREVFGNKIDIIHSKTATIKKILDDLDHNVSFILTGSDTLTQYKASALGTYVSVKEYYSGKEIVDGDDVIKNITKKEYVKKRIPLNVFNKYYDALLDYYVNNAEI